MSMFIEEFILKGYDRLNINNFNKIHFIFTKKIQVIIGTNGSGKSSILEELSPLPADKNQYSKDGYKIIKIRYLGKIFLLKSSFDPVFHSFKIDDEEQNPGGTITKQRELVKLYFNLDFKTHYVSIGKHKFTGMSAETRKEWYKNLADADFEYALGVYKRLRESFKDTTVALKLAKNRLVSQTSKMMPKSDLDALQKECEELYKVVEYMIENRNSLTAPLDDTKSIIFSSLDKISTISKEVFFYSAKLKKHLEDPNINKEIKSIDDIPNLVYYTNNKLLEIKKQRNDLFVEYKKAQEIFNLCEKTKLFKIASISTEIEQLKEQKLKIEQNATLVFNIEHPKEHLLALEEFTDSLTSISLEIPINKDNKFSRNNYKQLIDTRQQTIQEIEIKKVNIKNYEENLKHHQEHSELPDITCPACKHSFNPFFSQAIADENKKKIFTTSKEIEHKQKIVEDLEEQLKIFEKWLECFEAVKEIANHFNFMKDFWFTIFKKEVIYDNPRNINNFIIQYKENLLNLEQLEKIDNKINEELSKLNLTEHTQGIDYHESKFTLERLGKELDSLASEESRYNNLKDIFSEILKHSNFINKSITNIKELEDTIYKNSNIYLEDYLRLTFNNILRSFQAELASKEKTINDEALHTKTLKSLEEEIVELEKHSEAYKLLLKELSPTEGIIAEGLFGFMKVFTKMMNKIISNVWSYPLVIQPCSTEDDKLELNYRFPIYVNGSSKPRSDVSEGSRSMKEIINLSFYISAMKCCKLDHGTLFLDEFGSSMDANHKSKITRLIDNIALHENFAQIFIVSHDVSQYSALDNNEICILNNTNVIIPAGCNYNKHVVFE